MKEEKNRGITLIALVITIVILILLALVSMNAILGEEGLFSRANESKITQEKAEVEDKIKVMYLKYIADKNDPEIGAGDSLNEFLKTKGIVNPSNNVLNVGTLLERDETVTGKGTENKDVYILTKNGDKYTINYYNKDGKISLITELTEI